MTSKFSSLKMTLNVARNLDPKGLVIVICVSIIGGVFDAVGIASILPFLSIILYKTNSSELMSAPDFFIAWVDFFSLNTLISIYFFIFFFGIISRFFSSYWIHAFSFKIEENLGKRYLEFFFNKSFIDLEFAGPSLVKKSILNDTRIFIDKGLIPGLIFISQVFVFIILLLAVLYVDFKNSIIVFFTITFFYLLVFGLNSARLRSSAKDLAESDLERFRVLESLFGGVKEIYVYRQLNNIVKLLGRALEKHRNAKNMFTLSTQLPRYSLEFLAVVAMLVYFAVSVSNGSIVEGIPKIGLVAFVGYRLMPSLQQIYAATVSFGVVQPYLGGVLAVIAQPEFSRKFSDESRCDRWNDGDFRDKAASVTISLKGIEFPGSAREFGFRTSQIKLRRSNLVNARSGMGKTTLLNFISGLLGSETISNSDVIWLDADSCEVGDSKHLGQLAYLPQDVFLFPGSIRENIIWGSVHKDFRPDLYAKAIGISKLVDALGMESEEVCNFRVGENDFGLSGGQRKRVGVARVIYNDAPILLFDEPTAGLDRASERGVIASLVSYCAQNGKTLIVVSHSSGLANMFENIVELFPDAR